MQLRARAQKRRMYLVKLWFPATLLHPGCILFSPNFFCSSNFKNFLSCSDLDFGVIKEYKSAFQDLLQSRIPLQPAPVVCAFVKCLQMARKDEKNLADAFLFKFKENLLNMFLFMIFLKYLIGMDLLFACLLACYVFPVVSDSL